MNITLNKPILKTLILFLLSVAFVDAQIADIEKTNYPFRIGLELGSGYGFKLRSNNDIAGDYSRSGIYYTVRLKWGSGNVFGAGFETGWMAISSLKSENLLTPLGSTNVNATLNAIPVIFIVTTQYSNFQLYTGLGFYKVISTATVFNSTIISDEWDFGYVISLGYVRPISSLFRVGAEVKWNNISEVQISALSVQLRLLMKLLTW